MIISGRICRVEEMKRANPKKKQRKDLREKHEAEIEKEFWGTYELFVTALIYEMLVVENFSMEKVSDIMEGIGALIGEVHDQRMSLQDFKDWVGEETDLDMEEVFGT